MKIPSEFGVYEQEEIGFDLQAVVERLVLALAIFLEAGTLLDGIAHLLASKLL